jgi:hypothetical protein
MLAVKNRIDATYEPRAANDQSAVVAVAHVTSAKGANAASVTAAEQAAAADTASWVQDWASVWSSMATSMFDASSASISALGTIAAAPAATRPEAAASEVSLWGQPAPAARPRSWYRAPTPNLLDPATWGMPAPFAVYGVPVTPAMMGFGPLPASGMANWFGLGSGFGQGGFGSGFGAPFHQPFHQSSPFANPFARPPENPMTAWFSSFAPQPQPVNPWASLNTAMGKALAPSYATYRSDSGHAVAQITRVETKTGASSVQDAANAFWNLFAWPPATKTN